MDLDDKIKKAKEEQEERKKKIMAQNEIYEKKLQDLMGRIKENLEPLKGLLEKINGHWNYEDVIYRFYHHSYKVQWVKSNTSEIYDLLCKLKDPDKGMDAQYEQIVKEGLSKLDNINDQWEETRKWLEAFFHSKYFLEMVVKYGEEYDSVPQMLPSGFAAILELYNLR
jgi:lipopolysaccharide export LptBFGC system permease protein LptF